MSLRPALAVTKFGRVPTQIHFGRLPSLTAYSYSIHEYILGEKLRGILKQAVKTSPYLGNRFTYQLMQLLKAWRFTVDISTPQ
jgi:hypothetical protein